MEHDVLHIPRPGLGQQLDRLLEEGIGGASCMVWLLGDAGQGKTHFLKRYIEEVRESAIAAYAACAAPLGTQSVSMLNPYQPLKDVLEHLVANRSDSQRSLALVKNISLTVLACIPFVGEVAYGIKEIRRDWNEYKRGERKVDFERFIEEYFDTLIRLAEQAPVFVVFDDAHWMDKQTIAALEHFVASDRYATARIVFVLASRRPDLKQHTELAAFLESSIESARAVEISIAPFDALQLRDYLRMRFPSAPPDAEVLAWLEQKTGGNPFYLQSYIQHLLTEGLLNADGSMRGNLNSYVGLPAEIRTVTNWLLKALDEEALTLLLSASTLGYEFSVHEIAHLMKQPVLAVIRDLRRIRSAHGICEPVGYRMVNGRESSVFRFSQHAIHTALYNELTPEEREELHRTTAQYLNDLRQNSADDPEVLSSLASALILHARLGKQPEIEYESILLKARNATEAVDHEQLLAQLSALAPMLGRTSDDLAISLQRAISRAPYRTNTARGAHDTETEFLEEDDQIARSVAASDIIPVVLEHLRRNRPGEALKRIEEHAASNKKQNVVPHPLLTILHALALAEKGVDDAGIAAALEPALRNADQPAYQAFATMAAALLRKDADVAFLARSVKESSKYQGKWKPVLNTMLQSYLQSRLNDATSGERA